MDVKMNLKDVTENLSLELITKDVPLDKEIKGAYVSDMLSDVMANALDGDIWITVQVHQNVAAVAVLKELSAVIMIGGRKPADDTLQKALDEQLPIFVSKETAFELAGKLYQMGLRGQK